MFNGILERFLTNFTIPDAKPIIRLYNPITGNYVSMGITHFQIKELNITLLEESSMKISDNCINLDINQIKAIVYLEFYIKNSRNHTLLVSNVTVTAIVDVSTDLSFYPAVDLGLGIRMDEVVVKLIEMKVKIVAPFILKWITKGIVFIFKGLIKHHIAQTIGALIHSDLMPVLMKVLNEQIFLGASNYIEVGGFVFQTFVLGSEISIKEGCNILLGLRSLGEEEADNDDIFDDVSSEAAVSRKNSLDNYNRFLFLLGEPS